MKLGFYGAIKPVLEGFCEVRVFWVNLVDAILDFEFTDGGNVADLDV